MKDAESGKLMWTTTSNVWNDDSGAMFKGDVVGIVYDCWHDLS